MGISGLDAKREVEKFDRVACDYSQLHQASIEASGEGVEYFAKYKIDCLRRLGFSRDIQVLDFGCGIGNLTRLLSANFANVHGYDPSAESIARAKELGTTATYSCDESALPKGKYDLAVVSGVLHHVPPKDRITLMNRLSLLLKPGGKVVVFEHNPLNPLTQRAVDACPFDDDAVLLRGGEVKRTLKQAGFSQVSLRYIVFFPRVLAWLRPLEPSLGFCFLGAQTLTVGTRP